MASERIALPPGMYAISAKGGTVVVPQPGGILSVNSTYTTNKGEWQISGDGGFRSLADPDGYAWVSAPSAAGIRVTRNTDEYRWIINVQRNPKSNANDVDTFTGSIMTSDCQRNYWATDKGQIGNGHVILQGQVYDQWVFRPI